MAVSYTHLDVYKRQGLLVDESGSTRGELIKAAMVASAVVEDFCRELEIPHLIYGFSTYGNGPLIISYSEPHEIDGGNRYRITGMTDRDGTDVYKRQREHPLLSL